jgi:vacuolar-type H+-ATPase subunit I/STV1
MGFGRMIWRSTSIGRAIDTVKNVVEEGSVIDGVKKTAKEDLCEDNPITSRIYQSGKYEGKKEGYAEASDEYEEKLLKQADEFLKQKYVYESERDEYEALLDEYEKEIDVLSEKVNRTQAENEYLQQLLLRDRKLRKMVG